MSGVEEKNIVFMIKITGLPKVWNCQGKKNQFKEIQISNILEGGSTDRLQDLLFSFA